jgi:hypothetical protein
MPLPCHYTCRIYQFQRLVVRLLTFNGLQDRTLHSHRCEKLKPVRFYDVSQFEEPRQFSWYSDYFFLFLSWGEPEYIWYCGHSFDLLYQHRMIDDECGAVDKMRIGRVNRSTRRKPAPVPLCQPQLPHDLTRTRTQAAPMGCLSYRTALYSD